MDDQRSAKLYGSAGEGEFVARERVKSVSQRRQWLQEDLGVQKSGAGGRQPKRNCRGGYYCIYTDLAEAWDPWG